MSRIELVRSLLSPVGKVLRELEAESALKLSLSALPERAPAPGAASHSLAASGKLSPERLEQLKEAFRQAPITYTPKPVDWSAYPQLRTGILRGPDGADIAIVERNLGRQKAATELKAYQVHERMPFTNHMPVTVERTPGVILQERIGLSLEDWARRQSKMGNAFEWSYERSPQVFNKLFSSNRSFALQLEQAQAQRSIIGDFDSTPANFSITWLGKQPIVSNLDMNQAFELASKPATSNIANLRGHFLSESTLSKISSFLRSTSSETVKRDFQELGLSSLEIQGMKSRADWLLVQKKFPY